MIHSAHRLRIAVGFAALLCMPLTSCQTTRADRAPSIEITRVPPAGHGSSEKLENIAGRVEGAVAGERIVLFALSGVWWVQPSEERPFTVIAPDSQWRGSTHPGSQYAALLVDAAYRPPLTVNALPAKGGPVRAVAIVNGAPANSVPALQFSGYQWEIQDAPSNPSDPASAWTDGSGCLHLRVSKQGGQWKSAEVRLSRSLGFGSYRFVVRNVSHLEPAAVFALFTWDELGPPREMDIEISRWGEPQDKNSQYVIQPYVVPANTVRFNSPSGPLTYWMDWEPGRVSFKTLRGFNLHNPSDLVAEHVFTSGVPSPGSERIHMNLYAYGNRLHALQNEFEVVVEKFEFLP